MLLPLGQSPTFHFEAAFLADRLARACLDYLEVEQFLWQKHTKRDISNQPERAIMTLYTIDC